MGCFGFSAAYIHQQCCGGDVQEEEEEEETNCRRCADPLIYQQQKEPDAVT